MLTIALHNDEVGRQAGSVAIRMLGQAKRRIDFNQKAKL